MTTPIRETIARVFVETVLGEPDPKWAEHWQWYLDYASDPRSCVHYSNHGRGAQHADAVLRALDEAGCVVVPREASPAMTLEGARSIGRTMPIPNHTERAADAYRAMIAAAVVE